MDKSISTPTPSHLSTPPLISCKVDSQSPISKLHHPQANLCMHLAQALKPHSSVSPDLQYLSFFFTLSQEVHLLFPTEQNCQQLPPPALSCPFSHHFYLPLTFLWRLTTHLCIPFLKRLASTLSLLFSDRPTLLARNLWHARLSESNRIDR